MRHMEARITAIAGPARALYITHLIARLQRDAQRGATWTRLADRLIAQDTGLSTPQVRRARRWWAALGVIICHTRGIPPTEEYAIQATLTAWQAWLQANCIVTPASQRSDASVTTSGRQRHNVVTPASPLDHDHDDDDDARTHRQNAITQEIAQAETAARQLGLDVDQLKEECNAYHPKYPDRYYLRVLHQRIQAAQSPLPAAPPAPQRARTRTRNSFMRRQVQYTEEQRKAIEERARQELLSEAYSEENTAGRSP